MDNSKSLVINQRSNMFKFVVLLCAVFVASDKPPLTDRDTPFTKLEYILARDNWVIATEIAKESMANCTKIGNSPEANAIYLHRMKLNALVDYNNATSRYANLMLNEILRFSKESESVMKKELESHVHQVMNSVKDLINGAGNVDTRVCEKFSIDLTTTTMSHGAGAVVLWLASHCIEKHVSEPSQRINREINVDIFNGEIERIDEIRKRVEGCRMDGEPPMSTEEVTKCRQTKARQIVQGGNLINFVDAKIGEMTSLLNDIHENRDNCTIEAGFKEYHNLLNDVMTNTTNCVHLKLARAGMIDGY